MCEYQSREKSTDPKLKNQRSKFILFLVVKKLDFSINLY